VRIEIVLAEQAADECEAISVKTSRGAVIEMAPAQVYNSRSSPQSRLFEDRAPA
jgi:hypothetical protein